MMAHNVTSSLRRCHIITLSLPHHPRHQSLWICKLYIFCSFFVLSFISVFYVCVSTWSSSALFWINIYTWNFVSRHSISARSQFVHSRISSPRFVHPHSIGKSLLVFFAFPLTSVNVLSIQWKPNWPPLHQEHVATRQLNMEGPPLLLYPKCQICLTAGARRHQILTLFQICLLVLELSLIRS